MSEEISLKKSSLRLMYYHYKDSPYYYLAIVLVIITAVLLLFFQVVIPQFQNWFSIRNEVIATTKRVNTINKNINFMNNLDRMNLNNQTNIATSALPFDKNFGAIVGALSDASSKASVSLNDFAFQVGDIASTSASTASAKNDAATVELTITITGNVDGVQNFIKEIQAKLPLAEVISVDGSSQTSTIVIRFYQKQFPKIVYKDDEPLPSFSAKQLSLLEKLSGWQIVSQHASGGSASSSGVPLF